MRLPLPGAMGRYLREGLNLVPDPRYGNETFRGWLENARIVCSLGKPALKFLQGNGWATGL